MACPRGLFVFRGHHIEKREDTRPMGMTCAHLRVTEIKMVPEIYFGSVPPGLYALWLNNMRSKSGGGGGDPSLLS